MYGAFSRHSRSRYLLVWVDGTRNSSSRVSYQRGGVCGQQHWGGRERRQAQTHKSGAPNSKLGRLTSVTVIIQSFSGKYLRSLGLVK